MVGASELPFRLLCRRYGAELAYTPMMSSQKFATDAQYRKEEFQTCPADRPLVCHFAANNPDELAAAACLAEPFCDAIDLNLGCPQRTAYLGHFGSYLLDPKDRKLVCSLVRAASRAVKIPIFCKIRLLTTLDETIQLCRELQEAGCALIAVHARYRASWERTGPGARDGPAMMDQVLEIKKALPSMTIIANGNTVTFQDVQDNLQLTKADGLMSAEGILDNPALFLPRLSSASAPALNNSASEMTEDGVKIERLRKKLRKIARIEKKAVANGEEPVDQKDQKRLRKKSQLEESLRKLEQSEQHQQREASGDETRLKDLLAKAEDKLALANEYLDLATTWPTKMRTVIFHVRRMLKDQLNQYQLMKDCLLATTDEEVRSILRKIAHYQQNPRSFVFDTEKAKEEKLALERKRQEEGKRKAYEARMMRKAKREGKDDLLYYLNVGAKIPTEETVMRLKKVPRKEAMSLWKQNHSQHCLSFHLDEGGCKRGRACAFLHVDVLGSNRQNAFEEKEEVAG